MGSAVLDKVQKTFLLYFTPNQGCHECFQHSETLIVTNQPVQCIKDFIGPRQIDILADCMIFTALGQGACKLEAPLSNV